MARLLFFGKLGDLAGAREREMALGDARTVAALIDALGSGDSALGAALNAASVRYAVNEAMAPRDAAIADSDEIAFLPPVSGG